GLRLARHVHQTHCQTDVDRRLHRPRTKQRADVIDQSGTDPGGTAHDLGRAGVHGYHRIESRRDRFDHRHYPVDLLLDTDQGCTGARGFAADIDDGGTSGELLLAALDNGINTIIATEVGEGVMGYI